MRISDWSSDVCSSDLPQREVQRLRIDPAAAALLLLAQGDDQSLGDREHHPDWIEPDDTRQRARFRPHQAALRVQGASDLPRDRSGDARIGQVESGCVQGRLCGFYVGVRYIEGGLGLVERGLGCRPAFDQLLRAGKGDRKRNTSELQYLM